ncbi:hypothetical protein D9619_008469 [Psilocybe cf. subviscida]|uniref:Uncharacterized protein n=1 Tax=Psilocybe cf. subviscida TaxID=2480587 RepID=A0A8H5BAB5_9AGAR|nr:hypothetical protein D9619_008469 [Psilocybe cf. subviscida]
MTDLTVLVSPIPLYPETRDFTFGRRSKTPKGRPPIMVTLETEIEQGADDQRQRTPVASPIETDFTQPATRPRRSRTPQVVDQGFLSPPVNTWKSRPRHRPTRSQSAPPERRSPGPAPPTEEEEKEQKEAQIFNQEALGFRKRNPNRSFTAFNGIDRPSTRGGELVKPPPPLLRPTTFWRKTRRSGVTGASYSPSSHLIRRSTYIAAGLTFDAPVHDLSALCVESRVGFIVIPPIDQTFV